MELNQRLEIKKHIFHVHSPSARLEGKNETSGHR
jgi:hypothetical protein